jgi:hypothetical protein
MRLDDIPSRAAARPRPLSPPARRLVGVGRCRCFLCGHESVIPLPLSPDQAHWIECEWCGLDNEIPEGTPAGPLVAGRVPTQLF